MGRLATGCGYCATRPASSPVRSKRIECPLPPNIAEVELSGLDIDSASSLWTHLEETFGEDPYLIGELGAALIRGYQGKGLDDPTAVLATAKHYAGYSETQGGRDASEADISRRKLRSYFLPPFERAARAGNILAQLALANWEAYVDSFRNPAPEDCCGDCASSNRFRTSRLSIPTHFRSGHRRRSRTARPACCRLPRRGH